VGRQRRWEAFFPLAPKTIKPEPYTVVLSWQAGWRELQLAASASADVSTRRLKPALQTKVRATSLSNYAASFDAGGDYSFGAIQFVHRE
jgi:hypothetical protein